MAGSTTWCMAPTRPAPRMCSSTTQQWKTLWLQPDRYYLVITDRAAERLKKLVEPNLLTVVAQSGGKLLLTNHALTNHPGVE